MAESEIAFHVGVDWGAENHQVCILNASSGATVEEIKVAHQGAAMRARVPATATCNGRRWKPGRGICGA